MINIARSGAYFVLFLITIFLPLFFLQEPLLLRYQSDIAVLRFFAYVAPTQVEIKEILQEHFDENSSGLSIKNKNIYELRLKTINNYPFHNVLVRALDRISSHRLITSGVVSHAILKVIAAFWLLWVSHVLLKKISPVVIGLATSFFLYMFILGNPFVTTDMFFITHLIRSSTLFIIAAFLIALSQPKCPKRTFIIITSVIGVLLYNFFFGLFIFSFIVVYLLSSRIKSMRIITKTFSFLKYYLLYLVGSLLVILLLYWYRSLFGYTDIDIASVALRFVFWASAMAVTLLLYKLTVILTKVDDTGQRFQSFLFPFFFWTAILSAGIIVLDPDLAHAWSYASKKNFYLYQFFLRISGLANIAWVLLIGSLIDFLISRKKIDLVVVLLIIFIFVPIIFPMLYLSRKSQYIDASFVNELLLSDLGQGAALYESNILYYHAVANELAKDPTGATVIQALTNEEY